MRLLYLVHRLPYPPDKGDKVRSYHLLRHLAERHEVCLGTFVDDADDFRHLPAVEAFCADLCAVPLAPRWARLRSLPGLLRSEALSLPYYRDARLARWVDEKLQRGGIDAAVVFSSVMAQYVIEKKLPLFVDFVDMDSAKWRQYAQTHRFPLSWLYRREGERLFAFERECARLARRSFFVTAAERALFVGAAPEAAQRVVVMGNGVDADFFDPAREHANPYGPDEIALVFTGAMDYLPNADAACWFAREALPALRRAEPRLRFYVVGRNPTAEVQALAGEAVVVTGTVEDVRPYLAHAAAAVAPLRIARGIQNKILEAMAMAKPVVASSACAGPIEARPGEELLVAADAEGFVAAIRGLLADRGRAQAIGAAARRAVLARYSWQAHLAAIDAALEELAR